MSSIVLELQQDAISQDVPALHLLRKSLVVARKLGIVEFQKWVELELDGYSGSVVPEYRKTKGQLRGLNPYHGWQPIVTSDKSFMSVLEQIRECSITQPVSELSHLLDTGEKVLVRQLSQQVESYLSSAVSTAVRIEISSSSIERILEAIRDTILQWSLKLEEDGITGHGVSFSQQEKSIASKRDYTQIIQVNVGQAQMQNSKSENRFNSDDFQSTINNSNIASFANKVTDNAKQQSEQNNYTLDQQKTLSEAAAEIQDLLNQLSKTYSIDTTTGRMQIATEAVKRIESSTDLTQRIFRGIKAGSISALEQLLNHPAASFVIAALNDWMERTSDETD